jgi:hypothetical protein
VSVHHPRFVQFYVEKIIPDLIKNEPCFFVRNVNKIKAYLRGHGNTVDDIQLLIVKMGLRA